MFLIILGFFFLLGPIDARANQQIYIPFEDLPKILKENNKLISSHHYQIESWKLKTGHLQRSFLPTLNAQIGQESFQTERNSIKFQPYAGVEAKSNLYRGGRDELEERIRKEQLTVAEMNSTEISMKELKEARNVYWELVATKERIQILDEAIGINQKNLQLAMVRVSRGLSSQNDRLEFEIFKSQLEEELRSFQHQKEILEIHLKGILGLDLKLSITTLNTIPHNHESDFSQTHSNYKINKHSQMRLLKAQQGVIQSQKNQLEKWRWPSLEAYAGLYLHTQRELDHPQWNDRHEGVLGLRMNFEIFDEQLSQINVSYLSLVDQANHQKSLYQEHKLRTQIQMGLEDLKHEHELIHDSEHRIKQGKTYLSQTLNEYNVGVKNSLDVLSASQKYLDFLRQHIERRKNYQLAKTHVDSIVEE